MTNTTILLITTILWWFEKKNYVCVPSYFDQKLSLDKYTRPIHFLYSDCRQKYWNNIYTVFQVAKNILAFDLMLKIIDFVKTAKTKLPQFIENNKNTWFLKLTLIFGDIIFSVPYCSDSVKKGSVQIFNLSFTIEMGLNWNFHYITWLYTSFGNMHGSVSKLFQHCLLQALEVHWWGDPIPSLSISESVTGLPLVWPLSAQQHVLSLYTDLLSIFMQ